MVVVEPSDDVKATPRERRENALGNPTPHAEHWHRDQDARRRHFGRLERRPDEFELR